MSDYEDDDLDITVAVTRELTIGRSSNATASSDDEDDDLDNIPGIAPTVSRSQTVAPTVSHSQTISPPSQTTALAHVNSAPKRPHDDVDEDEEDEEDEDEDVPVRTKRRRTSKPHCERLVISDDSSDEDDAILAAWKRRKAERAATGKRRSTTTTTKKSTTEKGAKWVKIVGRTAPKKLPRDSKWRFSGDEDDDDDVAHQKKALPEYLRAKKERLDRAKRDIDEGVEQTEVFRVPPSYEDIEFSDDERLEFLESKPRLKIPPCAPYKDIHMEESLGVIPCSIAQYLRNYQVDGVKFMHRNFVFQEGCILGDDMGLGKTIQVIAFLTAAFGKTGDERDAKRMRKIRQFRRRTGEDRWYPKALVICPSSLISNWESEFKTWGWWNVYVYHGSKEDKEMALQAAKKGSLEIMITNYETYRLRHQDVNMVEWDCVIADECHKIKERSSETTQRMNEINALCRIGLTGTAIQNRYEELWTLLNWCRPGSIGTLSEWERKIAGPLRRGQTHDATFAQIGKARKVATMLVQNLLPRMFIRRMKTLIAHQLPKKTDKVVFCPLTETQREVYEAYLESETVQLIRDGSDPCDCGSDKKRRSCCHGADAQGRKVNELVFPAIMWVQKLSNHLANWIPDNTDPADVYADKLERLQICLPDRWRELTQRERLYNFMDPQMCGKWIVLQRLLSFWFQNGDKVLIFSYSLNLLHILHALFRKTEYNVCYLDGQMSLADRAKAVDDFNSDPDQFVFLISTKAGGVGLNITAANKVVIFDPNWNPSWDLQAQDRAYRIGQTRDVEVFRLISLGTIEEIVYARQIYKQQQANIGYNASNERRYFTGVMGDQQNKGELFGLKNLFSFQENTILQEIVNKTNVAERRAGVMVADMDGDTEGRDSDLSEGDDDEGGVLHAISHLAGDLDPPKKRKKKQSSPKNNPVTAILAEAGVSYTHENSEVIGTSKMEAQISKRALESTQDTSTGDKKAFDEEVEDRLQYKFRPPLDVRKRQFCTAAKILGFKDVLEFALVVESWTQEQRRKALERFYRMRIEGKDRIAEEDEEEEKAHEANSKDAGGVEIAAADCPKTIENSVEEQICSEIGETQMQVKKEVEEKTWKVAGTTIVLSDDDDDEL
jgi:SNF2 family DNA or RNA helicase